MDPLEIAFLSSGTFGLITGLALILINPQRMINRCCLVTLCLSALWLICIFMAIHTGNQPQTYPRSYLLFWLRMNNAAAAFLPWALYLTKEAILAGSTPAKILRRSLPRALVSMLLAVLAFSESFLSSSNFEAYHTRGLGYMVYLLCMAILCATILYDAVKAQRRCEGIARIELRLLVINFSLATLGVLIIFLINNFLKLHFMRYVGPVVVTASMTLTLWMVCYYRVFDARQVVQLLGSRVLFVALLSACAITIMRITQPLMAPIYGVFLMAIVTGSLALYLDAPARRWLGYDATLVTKRFRQTIINLASQEADEAKLAFEFENCLSEWSQANHATLLFHKGTQYQGTRLSVPTNWPALGILSEEGWITPEALDRRRKISGTDAGLQFMTENDLGAVIAVPRRSPTPSLLIGFGRKRSQRPYTYPDVQLLLEVAELMDNTLTHARVATRLAQIEKLESAAMMSRSLAHDLNNLATPVSSFLLHMESRVQSGTAEAEVLADAKHSLRVMQDYIRESLFFARRLVPDFRLASSAALLASTAKVTQTRAGTRGVNVIVRDGADISFTADATLLQRLLQNLVFNGIDATPRDGTVTLAATALGSDRIQFSIADEGPGVPPELTERIFEPYFTTKDTGDKIRGLGLGLAVSQKIANLHNGTINVGRTASGGALFTVTIPLQTAPAS